MSDVKIDMRALKASIADVLPVMKRPTSRIVPILQYARVVSDEGTIRFEVTDRFCVVYSTFAWADEGERFPEFSTFVDIDTLTAIKGYGVAAQLFLGEDGFALRKGDDSTRFSVCEPEENWPDLARFIDETWGDTDYFTPGEETIAAAFDPMIVKHIKGIKVIPRVNKSRKAWRIQALDRMKGVVMPIGLPG